MKNLKHFLLAPMMIVAGAFAFMACSNNDNGSVAPELSPAEIQKQWICDYAEEGVDPLMDEPYNRTVMAYEFFADGTGYFEFYTLYDDHLVRATATRNFDGDFTYTISGNTITIQFNGEGEGGWDLKYANGRLRDIFPNTYVPSTPEQQAELLKWCQEWDERVARPRGHITVSSCWGTPPVRVFFAWKFGEMFFFPYLCNQKVLK